MMSEYDWAELASVWTQPAVAHDGKEALRQALRRRVRMTALVVATELVLTAALLVWTLAQVRAGPDQASLAFGSILWVSWIVATGFAWWNRRGQWQRTVATTDEFIRISRVRADRKVRVAVFTGVLLEGRGVIRHGQAVHTDAGEGEVTSGTYSPTLERSIGLARLPGGSSPECEVDIRGRRVPARLVEPPFVRRGRIRIEL